MNDPVENTSFASLGLSENLLKAIAKIGYEKPTPIQCQAIPAILKGQDLMAAAQTGTGKTAGFSFPIIELLRPGNQARPNQVRALILVPTRELAAQVGESITSFCNFLPLRVNIVFGGVKINPQMMNLRKGSDFLVATPGRLLDLVSKNAVRFNNLEFLVLDEADRMLDMGFIHDIKKILGLLPKRRQNLMFSATFSTQIRELAKGMINNPLEISIGPRNTEIKAIEHWLYPVDQKNKTAILTKLILENKWTQVLVFTRTKHGANRLVGHLQTNGIKALAIHGNKSQGARTKALKNFKEGAIKILVATDLAARGLDIDQLPHVVNFDLPNVAEDYIHRIGRTGRAGSSGEAISLVSFDEFQQLKDIERLLKKLITRKEIEGFNVHKQLPESILDTRPIKPKKPKRPKNFNLENRE